MVRYLLALLVLSSTVEGLSSSTASSKNEAFVPEGLSSTSSNEATAPEGLSSTSSSEASAPEGLSSTSSNEAFAPEGLVSTSSNEASFVTEDLMMSMMSMPEGLSSNEINYTWSITGIASSDNTILLESSTTFELTVPIKIQSNVPVTIQRFISPFGNIVGEYPINNGAGSILVTSNCDSSETKVVPNIVQSYIPHTLDENFMTKTYAITLDSVSNERAADMTFLESSSYTMEYFDTSSMMGMYTAEDIDPTDPIYSSSPCPDVEACRAAASDAGITLFYVGEYPTGGCFQKLDKMFWGIKGDITVPPKSIQQSRVYCKNEVYYIDDIPPAPDSSTTTNPPVSAPVVEEEGGTNSPSSFLTPNFGSPTFVVDWTLGPTSSTLFPTISGPPKSLMPSTRTNPPVSAPVVEEEGGTYSPSSFLTPNLVGRTLYPTTSGPPNSLSPSVLTTCMTEAECKEASLAMGIEKFITGTFPTKGCFDKYNTGDGTKVAYWSEGGTKEEMFKSKLPGIQERITCGKSDESESAATTECEIGPMADSSKTCKIDEFCMLEMGICNTKIGIFTGVCSTMAEMCPYNYDPVRENDILHVEKMVSLVSIITHTHKHLLKFTPHGPGLWL